jgi:hypothetical protein
MVTRTQVQTLHNIRQYSNQSGLTESTLGCGFHFQHRNSGTFPIESFAHDSGRTLVCAEYCYLKGYPTVKEEIRRYSSQYRARLSAHTNDLVVNLMEQPDNNRRLRRHLPNDMPTRSAVLVFKVYFVSLVPKSHKRSWTYYSGVLLSTLLHATAYVYAEFAECTGTDCK